ncbi:MAG: sigma-70 family RNA polymerase sigma factor [Isosphaeraceae bacterium]
MVPRTRASLLVRLKSPRDEHAWAEFVEIYEPLIRRLARARGLQPADADDITQDVLRAVSSAIEHWDPDPSRGSFRAWLSRIARNLVLNLVAARGRQSAGQGAGGTDMVLLLEELPAADDEDSALFDLEYRRQVFACAAQRVRPRFHPTTWQAFWRTGVLGEDVAAVAADLGLSHGALYVARSRIMARLREEIALLDLDGDDPPSTSP